MTFGPSPHGAGATAWEKSARPRRRSRQMTFGPSPHAAGATAWEKSGSRAAARTWMASRSASRTVAWTGAIRGAKRGMPLLRWDGECHGETGRFHIAASRIDHRCTIHPRRKNHNTAASTKCTIAIKSRPWTSCPSPGTKKLHTAATTFPAEPCPAPLIHCSFPRIRPVARAARRNFFQNPRARGPRPRFAGDRSGLLAANPRGPRAGWA